MFMNLKVWGKMDIFLESYKMLKDWFKKKLGI